MSSPSLSVGIEVVVACESKAKSEAKEHGDLKRKRVSEDTESDSDSDSDKPCPTCAALTDDDGYFPDTAPNCDCCDMSLCSGDGTGCSFEPAVRCVACKHLVCATCVEDDGQCTSCASTHCTFCGETDADEKDTCKTCRCACDPDSDIE